jgi:hypothetical protein
MNSTFKRRFPTYMIGLTLGLMVFLVSQQLKKAFAPKFIESVEKRAEIHLAQDGSLRLKYAQEPGYFLIPGFPTWLTVSKMRMEQPDRLGIQLGYNELTEKETLIGPLHESGFYALKAELHICARPGEAVCVKRIISVPIVVGGEKAPKEVLFPVNLEAMLKEGLASAPTPAPAQSK